MKTKIKERIGLTAAVGVPMTLIIWMFWLIADLCIYSSEITDPDLSAFDIENRQLVIDMSYFEAESVEDALRAYGGCEDGVSEVCRIPVQKLTELGKRIHDATLFKKLNEVLDKKRKARGQE